MQYIDLPKLLEYVARLLVFLTAIPFHEAAHAFVSYKLGDPTARNLGRLTLNPLKHLDPVGFAAMLLVGIGWAKPVPIDARYYKNKKWGMALSAAAGPLSNLFLAFFWMLVWKTFMLFVTNVTMVVLVVDYLLYFMVLINIVLAIFNMLPIPPFDGSRIFLVFLPEELYFKAMRYERVIMIAVLALVWFGALDGVLFDARNVLFNALDTATSFLGKIY